MIRGKVVLLGVLAGLLVPSSAPAEPGDALYRTDRVVQIGLTVSQENYDKLTAVTSSDSPLNEYVPGTLTVDYGTGDVPGNPETVSNIGVRLKGSTSFQPVGQKPSLKLKMNEFTSGQKIDGLKGVTLNNMAQDPTRLRETMSYELFRAAGIPASRTGLAYVRLNGDGLGLYANVEQYDDVWVKRVHGTDTQHVYEAEGVDLFASDAAKFEVDEGDEGDTSDLAALISDPSAHQDIEQMTRMWAVEHYVGHWDGYSVDDGSFPNNFYLHSDLSGRFTMLPWGTDQTFQIFGAGQTQRDLGFGNTGRGRLFARCMTNADCHRLYRRQVTEIRALAVARDLPARTDALRALLDPYLPTEGSPEGQDGAWPDRSPGTKWFHPNYTHGKQDEHRTFVAARAGQAADWIAADRLLYPDPVAPPADPPVMPPAAAPSPQPPAGAAPQPQPQPTPAATPVRRCRVPGLKGRTLATATKRLRAAGCALGTVKRIGRGRMRVASQAPGRGVWRAGTKVRVTLRALPAQRRP